MALTVEIFDLAIIKLAGGAQSVSVDGMSYTQTTMDSLMSARTTFLKQSGSAYGFSMAIMKGPRH
jgi:hypothetical protein